MLNRVILIGRLTRDPELRYTPSGVAVTQFTLAVDRPFTGQSGQREADFVPIVVWRQQAEHCANYLRKGRLAAVEGRLQVRSYDNNEGRRVYVTEVIADNVRFLERADTGEGGGPRDYGAEPPASGGGRSSFNSGGGNRGGYGGGTRDNQDPFQDDGRPVDISDDDLPF